MKVEFGYLKGAFEQHGIPCTMTVNPTGNQASFSVEGDHPIKFDATAVPEGKWSLRPRQSTVTAHFEDGTTQTFAFGNRASDPQIGNYGEYASAQSMAAKILHKAVNNHFGQTRTSREPTLC